MGGVFQVDREIFHHDIWEDVVKFRIFFYILGQAIFLEEGVTVAGIKLERGQYLRSLRKLQEDLSYKEGRGGAIKTYPLTTLQNKIKTLVKDEQITIKSTESGTLFTVVNYSLYQGFERFKKGEVEQLSNSNRAAIEQSPNNNKKVKKEMNVKKEIKPSIDYDSEFELFWDIYKKKTDGKKAKAKFIIARKKNSLEEILEGTKNYMEKCESEQTINKYIKGPAVFLHGENFKDVYEMESSQKEIDWSGI
ncbi:MAG TPA: hypothetical protein VI423_03020 [Paenisporosarcina sp.]|nr:hypothetical protein [Paenisporosarcina sp.]